MGQWLYQIQEDSKLKIHNQPAPTIEVLPVTVNLYCKDSSELIACVENVDGCAATLTIMTAVNPDSWPEIAQAIGQALEKMYPNTFSALPSKS